MNTRVYLGALLLSALLMFIGGCSQKKPEPIIVENNETNETNETNLSVVVVEYDPFEWSQNDEVIEEGAASKIVVVKSRRVLVLFDENDNVLSRHRISLGKNPEGPKTRRGDFRTPEGIYTIIDKRPDKKYYRELLISYPNEEDKQRAKSLGVNPGNGITLHAQVRHFWDGNGDDYTLAHDWTNGCIAMTNQGMDNVWDSVTLGTVVEIRE